MQTRLPLITTVIPTFRRPALLRRAIQSALDQVYPHLQVCVYDNASGDETEAVVAELTREDPRVKYHRHPTNIGMSGNIAYGIARVNTPYFSLLSDDDYLLPSFYETALHGFEQHPDAMFSAGSTISMTEKGEVTHVPMAQWARDGYFTPPEGLFVWTIQRHPVLPGLLFRREVTEQVGFPDPDLFNSDFEYEWRVVSRFPYVVSRIPCAVFTVHEHQTTRNSDAAVWLHSYTVIRARLAENDALTPADRARAEPVLRTTFAKAMFLIGLLALRDGHFDQARKTAHLLAQEFGEHRNSRILSAVAIICARSRLAYRGLNVLYDLLIRYRLLSRLRRRIGV